MASWRWPAGRVRLFGSMSWQADASAGVGAGRANVSVRRVAWRGHPSNRCARFVASIASLGWSTLTGWTCPFVQECEADSPLTTAAAPVLGLDCRRPVGAGCQHHPHIVRRPWAATVRVGREHDECIGQGPACARLQLRQIIRLHQRIGTALENGHPHIHPRATSTTSGTSTRLACAGAPIRDPISRRIVGVLDLTLGRQSDPVQFALARRRPARSRTGCAHSPMKARPRYWRRISTRPDGSRWGVGDRRRGGADEHPRCARHSTPTTRRRCWNTPRTCSRPG